MSAVVGATFCLLATEARAQSVTIGGLGANSAVCTDAGGQIVSQNGGVSGNECAGAATPSDGTITATGTIKGGTLIATTGGLSVFDGGITVFNDDINMNGGNINNVTTINAVTGNVGTLNSTTIVNSGNTKTGSLTVDNNATVGGTLSVGGDVSVGGNLDMTGGDINNVATLNASTVNATTGNITTLNSTTIVNSGNTKTGSLTVDNDAAIGGNASVGGNLTVTGTSNFNGGANIANHLTVAPGTAVSMGNNRVQDVAAPIAGSDAANKTYVDTGLAKAFKEIDRNTQGIAIAMAMGGMALPDSKNFALGANVGFFDNKQAIAVQGALRLTPFVSVNGGIGMGLDDSSTLGGRVGVQVAW